MEGEIVNLPLFFLRFLQSHYPLQSLFTKCCSQIFDAGNFIEFSGPDDDLLCLSTMNAVIKS